MDSILPTEILERIFGLLPIQGKIIFNRWRIVAPVLIKITLLCRASITLPLQCCAILISLLLAQPYLFKGKFTLFRYLRMLQRNPGLYSLIFFKKCIDSVAQHFGKHSPGQVKKHDNIGRHFAQEVQNNIQVLFISTFFVLRDII